MGTGLRTRGNIKVLGQAHTHNSSPPAMASGHPHYHLPAAHPPFAAPPVPGTPAASAASYGHAPHPRRSRRPAGPRAPPPAQPAACAPEGRPSSRAPPVHCAPALCRIPDAAPRGDRGSTRPVAATDYFDTGLRQPTIVASPRETADP
ncbi:hypothetical protein FRC08_013756 [Ceratobasidium sp. 394]|nr:hypothetical protein FRC08_013756 [Ceratobasidium sp. 394]KAG9094847.1 hypothetical protein FS749_011712 [Ceratobasidium sp. UAMH 11750]